MYTSNTVTPGKKIDAFALKVVAIIGMTLDHVAIMFEDYLPLWFRLICYVFGGLTFPIMAYLIVEGYRYTSNFKRYSLRLLIFANITTVPFMWGMQTPALNVLFTLYLGLIILRLSDQMENRLVFYIIFFAACLGSIFMDWGLVGIPMIFLFKKLKGKKGQYFVPLLPSISVAIFQFVNSLLDPNLTMHNSIQSICFAIVGGLLVIPLLSNYNGERGRKVKYLFYLYYPIHLIVFGIIRGVLLSDWGLF